MRDSNGTGKVYGFVNGRKLADAGMSLQVTYRFDAMVRTMKGQEGKWMKDYSLVVNCLEMALL